MILNGVEGGFHCAKKKDVSLYIKFLIYWLDRMCVWKMALLSTKIFWARTKNIIVYNSIKSCWPEKARRRWERPFW